MIWQLDHSAAISTGRPGKAAWAPPDKQSSIVQGKYLIGEWHCREALKESPARMAFRAVQNATNQRTLIGTLLPHQPAGHSVSVLTTDRLLGKSSDAAILAAMCSFPADRVLRIKMSQNNVSWFYVDELPIPVLIAGHIGEMLSDRIIRSFATGPLFAPVHLCRYLGKEQMTPWKSTWAISPPRENTCKDWH
jgi:hypothetical protein